MASKALKEFGGVKRRFTRTGEVGGITVIDDYGHIRSEIAAVLRAARQSPRARSSPWCSRTATRGSPICSRISAPASTTPTTSLSPRFISAGETPIENADRDALVEGLRARGHRNVTALTDQALLAPLVSELATSGDLVVCLGAGNITAWANALPSELQQIFAKKDPQSAEAGR